MNFKIIQASSLLSPYIERYWAMTCANKNNQHRERIIPHGFVELTFYFYNSPVYIRDTNSINSPIVLNGQQDKFYDICVNGDLDMLSIVFKPYGAYLFLDIPINELYNQNIPAEYILKTSINDLHGKLTEQTTLNDKIKILEQFLLKKLYETKEYQQKRIKSSIDNITLHRGITNVKLLANNACLCLKQYERSFAEVVGISPKKFLKVVRFQNALYTLQMNKTHNLTELAYTSGYYDQSHMINEFKNLSGLTPKEYFSECEPYSDYYSF